MSSNTAIPDAVSHLWISLEQIQNLVIESKKEAYDKKWQEALDRKDTDYLDKHACPGLSWTFWSDWTAEEIAYYEDVERFPILEEGYTPNWNLHHPNWWSNNKDKQQRVNSASAVGHPQDFA